MTRPAILAVAILCVFAQMTGAADAKPRHKTARADSAVGFGCVFDNDGHKICREAIQPTTDSRRVTARYADATVIGGRPAGCPRRYCGCEASRYVFGRIIPDLNLAANWLRKFPRSAPAPGMVAARRGHVFVLISHVEGGDWLVHDGNSGGGKTRVHVRSISNYGIVNPHGSRVAMR